MSESENQSEGSVGKTPIEAIESYNETLAGVIKSEIDNLNRVLTETGTKIAELDKLLRETQDAKLKLESNVNVLRGKLHAYTDVHSYIVNTVITVKPDGDIVGEYVRPTQ